MAETADASDPALLAIEAYQQWKSGTITPDKSDPKELAKKQRLKNMFVCTHRAAESNGESTDMHSLPGFFTINNHLPFVNVHRKVPGLKVTSEARQHDRILKDLSFVPAHVDESIEKAGVRTTAKKLVEKVRDELKEER